MNFIKKRFPLILLAALLLAGGLFAFARPFGGAIPGGNLILNGDFSQLDESGMPVSWYTDAYFPDAGTRYEVTAEGAHIINPTLNDARFAQAVPVEPDTLYHLRGLIRADATEGLGANLSIDGVYTFSQSVYQSTGDWQEVSLYGRTGEKQTYVTVFARLGGYSGESMGEAFFKDITMEKVSQLPAGQYAQNFVAPTPHAAPAVTEKVETGAQVILLCCCLYAVLYYYLRRPLSLGTACQASAARQALAVAAVMLFAFLSRVLAAVLVSGYDVDIGCFMSWSMHMAQVGPTRFYNTVGFCDYPPGYMNILWIIGLIGRAFGDVTELMVKMPSIISDTLIALLLYKEGKQHMGHKKALLLSMFFALNPVTFISGACWGQTDSLMSLLLLISVMCLLRGNWKWALPAYVAAVLMKPQALMFGPMGLAALMLHLKNAEYSKAALKDLALGVIFSFLAFCALALPFLVNIPAEKGGALFLFQLYGSTMSSYGYVTINACNPYFLLGLNWYPSDTMAGAGTALVVAALATGPALLAAFLSRKENKRGVLLATCIPSGLLGGGLLLLLITGSLTHSALSTCMILYAVALCCAHFLLHGKKAALPMFAAMLLLLLFCCAGMMHERYLLPVVVLLFVAYLLSGDKRVLFLALLVTLSSFLNIACVLDRNIRISGAEGHLSAPLCGITSDMGALEYLSAVLTSVSCVLCTFIALTPGRKQLFHLADASGAAPAQRPPYNSDPIAPFTLRDGLMILAGTALYAVLAFTNLGSAKAPETAWVPREAGESVVLDLGEERSFCALYHSGIHWSDSSFSIETSTDMLVWDYANASVNIGDCFKWQYAAGSNYTPLTGRYVRITAPDQRLTIHEIILRDAETKETIPCTLLSTENETAFCLLDEQDSLEGEPGWYNSTYFDEIYHARTAYEHLHGLPTYETSHPPLGKVLMSFSVAVFGMNPFGWRFAGALAGVLMLPGMYLLGKLLSRSKWGGLAAMLLMAFDLMHFTQTRIATIDSFVVLFIIWSMYFMLYWFRMDFFGRPFWKTLVPLGLSGLFFGLSIASKWTGCYNGVGLAIIFFWGIWRRTVIWRSSRSALPSVQTEDTDDRPATTNQAIAGRGWSILASVASCLVFFIIIPFVIYYLSYIPYFAYNGGVSVQKVIQAAVGNYFTTGQVGGMLGYHAEPGLGMDHPFYTPWYEWPLIVKPIWYASSAYNTAETASTILAMGNPAVWWTGLAGLVSVAVIFILRHIRRPAPLTADRRLSANAAFSFHPLKDEPRLGLLLIGFLVQYVPWMLVPRGTYIYHYFPSVPFIILCTVTCLDLLHLRHRKAALIAGGVLLFAAFILFIAFFPYASGITVSRQWLDAMKWFPGWIWY